MKFFCCILISLLSYCTFAQSNTAILQGVVTVDGSNEPVENAWLHLHLSGGYILEQKTDSTGKYKFSFGFTATSSCTISIGSDKYTKSKTAKTGFLASKETVIVDLTETREYKKDFVLTKVIYCGPYAPTILFNTNSITSCNDSIAKIDSIQYLSFDNSIQSLYEQLKENSNIIIEIQAHASLIEKNPAQLSLFRAELIKEILIAKGLNSRRIEVKGWGTQKLLIKNNIIRKAKTKEEKQALHTKNQRVVFRVISWDFKEDKR